MGNIVLTRGGVSTSTSIDNSFIDNFMASADGDFVKVYLYLLRCMEHAPSEFSISAAAECLEDTEKDVIHALKYWESKNILSLSEDESGKITGISLVSPGTLRRGTRLGSFRSSDAAREFMYVAERYLGRPLTDKDVRIVFSWREDLGLSEELAEFVIETSVARGRKSLSLMQKTAEEISRSGAKTRDEARLIIGDTNATEACVIKAFGIRGRNLTTIEAGQIADWQGRLGFGRDVIEEACRRTIKAIGEPSFSYAAGILSKWKEQGVHGLSDIEKCDALFKASQIRQKKESKERKSRAGQFKPRSRDYDEFNMRLIANSLK